MSAARPAGGRLALLALLFVLPLCLRLWPIAHGAPDNFVPDTHVVRSALGMAQDKHPVPPVGRYSTYPYLIPYTLLPVYAADFALGKVSGRFESAEAFKAHVLEHPEEVHLLARIVTALFGSLSVLFVFLAARAMGFAVGSYVAAWLVATGLLHLHFSVQERPWVPMVAFCALACWPAALYAKSGRLKHLLFTGAACGGAFACHQAGLAVLGLAGCAWAFGAGPWAGSSALKRRFGHGLAAVAAFLIVSIAVGHPYLLLHGATPAAEVAGAEQIAGDISVGGQALVLAVRPESLARLSKALFGYDPVLVLLGLAGLLGLGGLWRRPGCRAPAVFALFWAGFFMTNQNDHVRYLTPLCVLLPFAAAAAGERLFSAGTVARTALVALLALPLVQALRLGFVLGQTDTRHVAEARLDELPAGAVVGIDRYGPLPSLSATSLERLAELRPLARREAHRLALLQAGEQTGGLDAVPLEDLFQFDDRHRGSELSPALLEARPELGDATSAQVLAALGVTHLLLVDRAPGDGVPSLLIDGGTSKPFELGPRAGEPAPKLLPVVPRQTLWRIEPGEGAAEARLPTELDFALTSIWQVSRPGPQLTLVEL